MVLVALSSCESNYSPKPRGYHRVALPEKGYRYYEGSCPFSFKYPTYATITLDDSRNAQPCWINVNMPELNGVIHLSYFDIRDRKMFAELTEDARTLAFKHTIRAEDINQAVINRSEEKVYGIYYRIDGNTASQIQFFATDSVKHYLRGSLYFNSRPQIDSLKPVLDFVKLDIDVMLKSLKWK